MAQSNEQDLVFNCCQMIKDETLAVAMDQKPLYTEEIDHIIVNLCSTESVLYFKVILYTLHRGD